MKYRVEIAESAERDISDVADVVAFAYGDPIGASRLANRIFDAIESLSEMPYRYSLSRNPVLSALDCHQFTVGNFNIVYRIDDATETVSVVAVAYSRRLTDFVADRL